MYYVVVYDVNVDRVNEVKKVFREYMDWIQNSVFEGQLTRSEKEKLEGRIKEIIDTSEDMVVFYSTRAEKYLDKEVLGVEKSPTGTVI
ncbi:CRISPR-associated protein Cas2 [candidate division MSBL1 archaeon SCGC-AAA259E17]|uniref:CRISPR-associated endoribonuclease Cas2 n=1 Tax=candidate division MSBL1 archaeon SCGC-AAA259E17 TaxID=1698263 RepID=A0A133UGQ1_9EURY|nr:CRISPR-associated protein Cas2 [candidate division MSBL1 archaeon SCGC-AAA259E17]